MILPREELENLEASLRTPSTRSNAPLRLFAKDVGRKAIALLAITHNVSGGEIGESLKRAHDLIVNDPRWIVT